MKGRGGEQRKLRTQPSSGAVRSGGRHPQGGTWGRHLYLKVLLQRQKPSSCAVRYGSHSHMKPFQFHLKFKKSS